MVLNGTASGDAQSRHNAFMLEFFSDCRGPHRKRTKHSITPSGQTINSRPDRSVIVLVLVSLRLFLTMKKHTACPSWLDLSKDRSSFVFVPERAKVVRKIFELSIGGLGSYSIAKQFGRQGVKPFGSSPKWDHTNIDNLLRNRATLGEYQPKSYAGGSKKGVPMGDPIAGYYPAVIDEKTFIAAQEARRQHLRAGRGRKGTNLANLFTGITTCGYCGSLVKFHSNNSYKSLICQKVLDSHGCVRAGWSYKNFEVIGSQLSLPSHFHTKV